MPESNSLLSILVVEDNPADLFVLEGLLWKTRLHIHKIFKADSYAHAAELLATVQPHLIFLDLSLLDSTGLASFSHINQIAPSVPIIVLTGLSDMDMALETMANGAQDYLVKGEFDEKLLSKSIQYSIERKKNLENIINAHIAMEQKLEEARIIKQKEIAEAVIVAQEKERHDISRELHDNVNQQLTVAMMYIASAEKKQEGGSEILKQSASFILNAIEEIRSLTKNLVTPLIKDFGLVKAIESALEDVSMLQKMQITFNADSFYEADIQYDFKLSVFRIIQEQLNNVLKHASATHLTIELGREANKIILLISDDGIGFEQATQKEGIGIYNISSRVELFDGIMNICSAPDKGCSMYIEFPVTSSMLVDRSIP
ncbi:MAG: putative signal transduction histidine kinase [Chitinophagaceae bacterium]|nr:MAG: putative signal transduction histidine kinase [Chitinophagaceae bacterium]